MILTQSEIKKAIKEKKIIIEPYKESSLSSNSYDIHLSNKLAFYENEGQEILDAKKKNTLKHIEISSKGFVLQPNKLYLGLTQEFIRSDEFVPLLEGKSSIGRLGISIHVTAGKGDLGYANRWTLEIFVVESVRIYPWIPIGQLIFFKVFGTIELENKNRFYSSTANLNQADQLPVGSKSYLLFDKKKIN